jgi:hypothetical protein
MKWSNVSCSLIYGSILNSQHLNATLVCDSVIDGQYVYEPPVGTLLDVGQHTLSCCFIPSDPFCYEQTYSQSLVVVTPYPTKLAWMVPSDVLPYGVRLSSDQLNAVVVDPQGLDGTFNYNPALGNLLTAGRHVLTVSFTPDSDNYKSVEATIDIIVAKDPLNIRWSKPAPMIATPSAVLTSAQLNAIVESQTTSYKSLSGTFIYEPPLDSLIDFSNNSVVLSVRFDPEDVYKFESCSCSVLLEFEKPPLLLTCAPQIIEYGV